MRTAPIHFVCLAMLLTATAFAAEHDEGVVFNFPDKVKWQDGPPSLAKGSKIAVLEGDPNKEGPFVFRLKLPDGYLVAPHEHPKKERVTVVAGTLNLGMGEKFDAAKTTALPAGTYGTWEAGMKHFAWVKGETIIQLHGIGPWTIKYVNPADDPRNQAK
jgi:uncharacterized protein DUF4437